MIASNEFRDIHRPFLHGRKGASGSWAEPYFACPTLRCGGFAYPPGILEAIFTRELKENRILYGIRYSWISLQLNKNGMEDINIKSVRYPEVTDQKFEKIALKLGRTKRQVFIQMVDYFYKSKKDPMDLNDELLKNTLMKNHQQYVGFIKTQENMLLVPMKNSLDRIYDSQRQVIDRFNTEVLKHNVNVLNNQNVQAAVSSEIGRLMEAILQSQKSKELLKTQFISILESYIRSREAFTMMTPSREKEELIAVTKKQVRLL